MRKALLLALAACALVVACQAGAVGTLVVSRTTIPLVSVDPVSGLPFVDLDSLPPEAAETLALIESNGPFPYDQDGAVFQNREGILPDEGSDYYHEYTVEMPGSPDRGARRIVTGSDGQLYWTGDHYDSFQRIRQ